MSEAQPAAPRPSTALPCSSPPSSTPTEPLTFADLQEACDLPKSTTSRMLTALERSELLERTDDGSYVAGGLFWLYAARHDPGEDLVRLARPDARRDRRGDPRDGQPEHRPRRPGRAGRAGRLAVPPRHPRLDPGRRARPLHLARQGLPGLGRRVAARTVRSSRPTDASLHRPRGPARRPPALPHPGLGDHRRRARDRARRRRRAGPGQPRPGGRRPRRLGTHHQARRTGSTSSAGC